MKRILLLFFIGLSIVIPLTESISVPMAYYANAQSNNTRSNGLPQTFDGYEYLWPVEVLYATRSTGDWVKSRNIKNRFYLYGKPFGNKVFYAVCDKGKGFARVNRGVFYVRINQGPIFYPYEQEKYYVYNAQVILKKGSIHSEAIFFNIDDY